jgi:hypothetical protein
VEESYYTVQEDEKSYNKQSQVVIKIVIIIIIIIIGLVILTVIPESSFYIVRIDHSMQMSYGTFAKHRLVKWFGWVKNTCRRMLSITTLQDRHNSTLTTDVGDFKNFSGRPRIVFWFKVDSHSFFAPYLVFGIPNVALASVKTSTNQDEIWIEGSQSRKESILNRFPVC